VEDRPEPLLGLVDETLFPEPPQYSSGDAAGLAHVDPELATRLWRTMGFTEATPGELAFYPQDAEALAIAAQVLADGTPIDSVIRQTRVMNASVSRIAESLADEAVAGVQALRQAGASDTEVKEALRSIIAPERFEKLMGYFLRRHMRAALWRKLATPASELGHASLAVGFVDLVRFTAITEEVAEDELDALVSRFGDVAQDRIARSGGRMVKMIGDEVMFVADDAAAGTLIALDLVDAYASDEHLPSARAGVAWGEVLSREGDYFGPVVNLASRSVDVARPESVVASDSLHDRLVEDPRFSWRRMPPKRLKGIGLARLWSVRRASD
jgi:adenylate cyclase